MSFNIIFAAGCAFTAVLVAAEILLYRRLRRPVPRRVRRALPVAVATANIINVIDPRHRASLPGASERASRAIPASIEEVPR